MRPAFSPPPLAPELRPMDEPNCCAESRWKAGPLPPGTWHWGGVILVGQEIGFHFADFHGDHVVIHPGGQVVPPTEVAWYDNSIRQREEMLDLAARR